MKKIIEYIKRVLKMKSFSEIIHTIKISFIQRKHIFFINDIDIKNSLIEMKAYKKLKKKYSYVLENIKIEEHKQNKNNVIWICWLQGIENAPTVVQKCIESVRKNFIGKEIKIITSDNFQEYVDIPEYIITKWQKGMIGHAHFSDILRVWLLTEYGGIWMDATVYVMNSNIPQYFYEAPLFLFSNMKRKSIINISNWYISAYSHNPILQCMKELLKEYWKKEKYAIHYFIFHLFFKMVCESNEYLKNEWKRVPKFSNIQPHLLANEIFEQYTEERQNQLADACPIQKLSYKLRIPEDYSNSFYKNYFR